MREGAVLLALSAAAAAAAGVPDFKVARGLGAHGYNAVRISVVNTGNDSDISSLFSYNQPFQHRWLTSTDNGTRWLHSTLVNVTPGAVTPVAVGGASTVGVRLPLEGAGVSGVLMGDPCTEPGFVGCIHFNSSDPNATMALRLPRLLNALADVDFRAILGDNLYDTDGGITERFFGRLTPAARAVFQPTVPGNHDFWRDGLPVAKSTKDQFGNGFLQYYGQDVMAGKANLAVPYDLSANPDDHGALPTFSNFFFYNKIGNVGFIGFSGAHSEAESASAFEEACSYFEQGPQPAVIYLMGHWNTEGLGCSPGMHSSAVFSRVAKLQGCNHGTLRYTMGHDHCNRPADATVRAAPPVGFLLGGAGVRGNFMGCNTFGFAYVSTTSTRELVVGFELASPYGTGGGMDKYDEIVACFEAHGAAGCLHYGTVWRNTSIPSHH
eukprot:m.56504 g.56504  ORF g.56504 m.56504 type:complete len:437 (-) comp9305_c0_seq1:23-1333(-)